MKNINEVKKFWNDRPCNLKHSQKQIGTKEYFDEVEKRKYFVEPHIPEFAEFKHWRMKNVLEIGCGIGTDTINFARNQAKKVTAVDLSETSLEIARKRAKLYRFEKVIRFYQANAENLSKTVPVEKYDLIYSFGVIHHTPHPKKVIAEIKKYMDKNSVMKIMVYHRFSWKVIWIILKYGQGAFWLTDKLIAKYSEAQTGCPVTYSYTKKSIEKLLKGMKIIDIQIEHIFPYSIPEYKKYQYNKVWYFRYLPQPFFNWLESKLGWHLCVTAKLI
jgi:ubiquinone/menaquinone biosynthesis C-methylase UbiE